MNRGPAASKRAPPCPGASASRYHERFAAPARPSHDVLEFPMKLVSFATLAALAALPAAADEGMWTFDNQPAAAIERKYGSHFPLATPTPRPRS